MGKNAGRNLQYGPRTRLVRGMYYVCYTYRREDKTWAMIVLPAANEEAYEFHLRDQDPKKKA